MNVEAGTKTCRGTVRRVLHTATVLHKGWEMDNQAWAVEFEDGTSGLLTTSHGALYVAELAELNEKLRETEASAASLRALLSMTN